MTEHEQASEAGVDQAAEQPKRKSPQRPVDLFSSAKAIALKLEPHAYEEQLQLLEFVRQGIESKRKAHAVELAKQYDSRIHKDALAYNGSSEESARIDDNGMIASQADGGALAGQEVGQ